MKIEGLNMYEVYALFQQSSDGECVIEDCTGEEFYKAEGKLTSNMESEPSQKYEPFKVIKHPDLKPKPKSLSFEEAVDLFFENKTICIKIQSGIATILWELQYRDDQADTALAFLHVADRRGWYIYRVADLD